MSATVSLSNLKLSTVSRGSSRFIVKYVAPLRSLRAGRTLGACARKTVGRDLYRVMNMRFEGYTAIKKDVCKECNFSSILAVFLKVSA